MLADLTLAQKIFLEVEYSTILSEIRAGRGRGQIVRRMKCEGYGVEEALDLYNKLSANTLTLETIVMELQKEIEELKFKRREYEKSLMPAGKPFDFDRQLTVRTDQEEKFKKEMVHMAIHIFPHLIFKIFGG